MPSLPFSPFRAASRIVRVRSVGRSVGRWPVLPSPSCEAKTVQRDAAAEEKSHVLSLFSMEKEKEAMAEFATASKPLLPLPLPLALHYSVLRTYTHHYGWESV